MTDVEDDGKYHLLDGDAYNPSDLTQQALYYWNPGEPNKNIDENCVFIFYNDGLAYGLGNMHCKNNVYKKPIKGICEICESWKL